MRQKSTSSNELLHNDLQTFIPQVMVQKHAVPVLQIHTQGGSEQNTVIDSQCEFITSWRSSGKLGNTETRTTGAGGNRGTTSTPMMMQPRAAM